MKHLFLLLLLSLSSIAQNNKFELSLGSVIDKSLNRDVPSLGGFVAVPAVINRFAGCISIGHELEFNQHLSFISSARMISRKIEYSYSNVTIGSFAYNVLEIPLGLRLAQALNPHYKLLVDVCPGVNMAITNDSRTDVAVTTDKSVTADRSNQFEFTSNRNANYFAQIKVNLLSKINERSALLIFVSYQKQFTALFKYRAFNNLLEVWGNPIKTDYFAFGLSYQFWGKKGV